MMDHGYVGINLGKVKISIDFVFMLHSVYDPFNMKQDLKAVTNIITNQNIYAHSDVGYLKF